MCEWARDHQLTRWCSACRSKNFAFHSTQLRSLKAYFYWRLDHLLAVFCSYASWNLVFEMSNLRGRLIISQHIKTRFTRWKHQVELFDFVNGTSRWLLRNNKSAAIEESRLARLEIVILVKKKSETFKRNYWRRRRSLRTVRNSVNEAPKQNMRKRCVEEQEERTDLAGSSKRTAKS